MPSIDQIKRALHIQETIESLKSELASIFGGTSGTGAKRGRPAKSAVVASGDEAATIPATKRGRKPAKKKRVMSAEARERIAAAQRKRWAKQKKAA